ncbi:MAG: hypothetical protein R3194_11825, partial [Limnobacter sp.]|nr:hypothetical protein [Limnobacter sp.]
MIKRMVLFVKAGLHADLMLNGMVLASIKPGCSFECAVHEFLVDGENHFALVPNFESGRRLSADTPVSLRLELRHGQAFRRESGRQVVLEKKGVLPLGTVVGKRPLFEFRQHIPAGFPRWQFLSSLGCEALSNDKQKVEAFLLELDFAIRQKDIEFVCNAFSHRNQELAAAYGLTDYES